MHGAGEVDAVSAIISRSMLLPCFEPRALPSTATSPSTTPTTGLMDRRPPASATAAEMRPPRLRYSRVSRVAITLMSFFSLSRASAIEAASRPASRISTARSARILSPMVTLSLSTTKAGTGLWAAATRAFPQFPRASPKA